jgi:uncharacterized protein YndB with AHSA1/START domain
MDKDHPNNAGSAEPHSADYGRLIEPGTLRFQRLLPGPIELVWAFLTESEKRGQWLASGEMELKRGGRVELMFQHDRLSHEKEFPEKYQGLKDGHRATGIVTECDPPRLLSYTWGGEKESASEVTFELTPKGDSVLLVITQRRLVERKDLIGTAAGWHAHTEILNDILSGNPPHGFWTTHARLEHDYDEQL